MTQEERNYKMLKLADLVADKNFNTAVANRELQQLGEWRTDHDRTYYQTCLDIAALTKELDEKEA